MATKKPEGKSRVIRVEVTLDPATITDDPMTEGELQKEAEEAIKGILRRGMRSGGIGSGVSPDPVVGIYFIEFEEFCPKCEDTNITKKYESYDRHKCRCYACEHEWEESGSWEKRRKEADSRPVSYAVRT